MDDGRFSIGGFAKGGLGVTGGSGGELWIDFGQMRDDAVSGWNAVTGAVTDLISGVDTSRN
jgi:hypothetical protein